MVPWLPQSVRKALFLVASVLPIAFFVQLFLEEQLPREAWEASQRLSGRWRVLPGNTPGGELASVDDAQAPTMKVPGSYRLQGFTDREAWLRFHFRPPASLVGQPLAMVIGDTRSGYGTIFLNGQRVGDIDTRARGLKAEVSGYEAWSIPADRLQPGENLIAIHFIWPWLGADGINSDQALLGPASLLLPHYEHVAHRRRAFHYGVSALIAFFLLLFFSLLVAEWESPNRSLYLSCIGMLSASLLFLGVRAGIFFEIPLDNAAAAPVVYLSIIALIYAWPDFGARYLVGPQSRFRKLNGWVAILLGVAQLGLILTNQQTASSAVFVISSAYGLIPVAGLGFIALSAQIRRPLGVNTVLCTGFLCAGFTGGVDFAHNLGLLSAWGYFPLGVSASAIAAALMLIGDFTKVSFENKDLSASLKKTNADLADALVRAQEASRLKSEFVANVSHELRTPLNSVLNIPEGLLEQFAPTSRVRCSGCEERFELEAGERLDADSSCPGCGAKGTLAEEEDFQFVGAGKVAVNGLRQIHRSGKHLLSLIDDVLDFSKLEAGKMRLTLEQVELRAALQNVLETLEPIARPRGIRLRLEVPPGETSLRVDSVKLAQILINLIGNAVKFSPDGAEVVVSAEAHEQGYRLGVRDRGIGIAPEHHQSIFESFRQVDGSHTRKFGGTGLGLAITRKLAEAHGGRIWVESTPGLGSTFFVYLPREGPAEPSRTLPVPLPAAATGRTLLVLDDDRVALENLRLALQPLGHHVEGIQDPRELEQALERVKPDLLILDVMMPRLSGLDVLRMLRQRERPPPVLVSSAYHANIDVVRALGASWLAKPWRSDELQAEVTRLLLAAATGVPVARAR